MPGEIVAQGAVTDRTDWLAERRTYIGASEVAAILLDDYPHLTPHQLWRIKRGEYVVPETFPMRRGTHMEPLIADEFTRITGIETRESRLYRHPKWPFIACNPDREITVGGVDGLLELKDVGYWPGKQFGKDGADQVPEHYLVQVAYQMIATGRPFAYLCACVDGREVFPFLYSFDPGLFEHAHILDRDMARAMVRRVDAWWSRHVVGGEEPALTDRDGDVSYLRTVRGTYDGVSANADEEADALCVSLRSLSLDFKAAEVAKKTAENAIKKFMADHGANALETSVGWFTWKTDARGVATFRTPFKTGNA